jgi:hypothetical protein
MQKFLTLILLVAAVGNSHAQDDTGKETPVQKGSFGIGLGLDYGGIGGKIAILPSKNFGLFAGLGYNFVGAGINAGVVARLSPDKRACPYLTAMYGYNAAIRVSGDVEFSETYYGPSMGFGVELHGRRKPLNFFSLELLVPFRSSQFNDDLDAIQSNPFIDMNDLWPVTISFGYHWGF